MGEENKDFWNKLGNWFIDAAIQGAVNENPAVMTASGWQKDQKWHQERTQESDKLADNLAAIGEAAITAPTFVGDLGVLYNTIRHPVQTVKKIYNAGRDALWFIRNPRAVKVYHGTKKPFDLKDARTASPNNIGIHVTPHKEIAENVADNILEAWIPRHNTETIDIWENGALLLTNDYTKRKTGMDASRGIFDQVLYYNASGNPKLQTKLLKKYGGDPTIKDRKLYLSNDVTIPLRSETFPKIQGRDAKLADKITQLMNTAYDHDSRLKPTINLKIKLNQKANDLLSRNNYKVIKYQNVSPSEVENLKDGTSYIITDPNVFYIPKTSNDQILKGGSFVKYPFWYYLNNNQEK